MGSGYKDFQSGEVLTSTDVDGYLMRQTVMTFANASARNSALSGVLDEGMIAYLEDTNRTTFYDGTNWQDISVSSSIGTWTTYTPTWTNLTVGNGTVAFAYTQINKLVHVNGRFTLGSTSTVGNNPIFTLPVARHTSAIELLGTGILGDTGTGSYMAMPFGVVTDTSCYLYRADHTVGETVLEGGISATNPMTWTTNDFIYVNLTYRAA